MAVSNPDAEIFSIDPVLVSKDIKLTAWCQNGRTQILALYLKCNELILCLLTDSLPVVRRFPWYKNGTHTPVSLSFSPAGSFLLVLSEACHLHAVPAMSILDPLVRSDMTLSTNDVTFYAFPYKNLQQALLPSSSSDFSYSESSRLDDIEGSAVTWYTTVEDCQQIGIVATKSGDVILLDLLTGIRVASTTVRGCVTDVSLCLDNGHDSVFLLITTNDLQYELLLEQRLTKPGGGSSADETDEEPPKSHRGRLHGFKEMTVEKLHSIKLKIAETRARAHSKPVPEDVTCKPFLTEAPKLLEASRNNAKYSRQYFRGRYVISSFHNHSQLLALHSTLMDKHPLFVHKMPAESSNKCLVTDRVIFVVSQDRRRVLLVSSLLSESPMERSSEFNPDCILGDFNVCEDERETVIDIFKSCTRDNPIDVPSDWKVDLFKKMLDECAGVESCLVVTNRRVLRINPLSHVVCAALRLILDHNDLIQAERICKIFEINSSKLLELAGDINLARLKIPVAIAHYKLASCGPLRITVKLAKLGHCCELLSYSTALLMTANANLSLTDHMHISNLLLMAFVHQILSGASAHLKRKYLTFLETNDYFDKGLGMNINGQSLLFAAVHKLIVARGLIYDGLAVIGSIIKSFGEDPSLLAAAQDENFWACVSEPMLQEAYVICPDVFSYMCDFLQSNLSTVSIKTLSRLCRALDVSAPYLRPHLRRIGRDEEETEFPIRQLVQAYLTALLVRISKNALKYDGSLMIPFKDTKDEDEIQEEINDQVVAATENSFWPGRKEKKVARGDECETKILSCGFGHSGLIRNGLVYTWGLSNKGCLGHGPGLARNIPPHPITMFSNFRIQVSQVSCGRAHTTVLTNNGVYAWGSSTMGQLGLGSEVLESPHPRLVSTLASHRAVLVECGQYHTMFLTNTGQLFGCGWNVHGQLGLGTIDNESTPTIIHTLREFVINNVACGHGHTVVLTDKGHVYTFGSNMFGQLGNGSERKRSLPTLVRGISGKVSMIATGYFHNLAVTVDNELYTWGASPQVLRLQGQAHKRARAMQMQPPPPPTSDSGDTNESPDTHLAHAEIASSEAHLTPSLVDTRNVPARISQIACGNHHNALLTESGAVFTWGRSMDGQLGNGARTEVVLPSLIQDGSLRASTVALGADFTVVVEKRTGKVFAWGSNGSRQIGIPIKESAAKATDGKVIIVRQVKRVVRLPNSVANVVDSPAEVPDIPSATFTYQPLISTVPWPAAPPPVSFTPHLWHSVLHAYSHLVNHDLLLCKCLELGNLQAASKVLLLRGQYRQAVVYQLKAVQKAYKGRALSTHTDMVNGNDGSKTVQTPDTEMHPFTVQGGVEGMCDMDNSRASSNGHDSTSLQNSLSILDISTSQYCAAALEILLKFLLHAPEENAAEILETGIQFWSAEKLPMSELESFLLEHIERVFYPLGTLLYLGKRELARNFSAELQLRVTTRLVEHVDNNGSCEDFVAALSKLLSLGTTSVEDLSTKLKNPPQKVIHVTWPPCPGDTLYVFSCGHSSSNIVIPPDQSKLAEAYSRLDTEGVVDMACPDCVCGLISTQVA